MKKRRSGSGDRSGDRWIHDLCNASLGVQDIRKDQCLDAGVKDFGSRHRQHFPHQNIIQAVGYMCWRDVIDGRPISIPQNIKLSCGHFIVDSISSKVKKKMQLLNTLSDVLR